MPARRGRTITSFGQMFGSLSGGIHLDLAYITFAVAKRRFIFSIKQRTMEFTAAQRMMTFSSKQRTMTSSWAERYLEYSVVEAPS